MKNSIFALTLFFFVSLLVSGCRSLNPYYDKSQRNWKTANNTNESIALGGDF